MRLVEDQRVVAQQAAVSLNLGEQNAVGHQLDQGRIAGLVGEAHGVADSVAERGAEFVGDALRDSARREPAGLGVADGAADTATEVQADLGQLRGLARARRTGDHDHLVLSDGFGQLIAVLADRQVGIGDGRDGGLTGEHEGLRRRDLLGDLRDLGRLGAAEIAQAPAQPVGVPDGQVVETGAQLGD